MSRWKELFQNHQVHLVIKDIIDLLNIPQNDANADEEIEKRRLSKIINLHKEVLAQLDPEITPFNSLINIDNCLRNSVINQIRSYNKSRNLEELKTANENISNNLPSLSQLLSFSRKIPQKEPIKNLEKAVDDFYKKLDSKKQLFENDIKILSNNINTQQGKLNELTNNIDNKKRDTDNLITSWQQHFSEAQNNRNESFSKDQNERSASYNLWYKELDEKTRESIQDLYDKKKQNLDSEEGVFKHRIAELISDATKKHAAICDLYKLSANDSVAGGYQTNAEEEKRAANIWRRMATAFIIVAIIWAMGSYCFGSENLTLTSAFKAFSVMGVLLFGAGYSAKQSSLHRKNEKRTRWFALEVKAIDPFIESLEDTDKKALKNELSKKLFGNNHDTDEKDHGAIDGQSIATITKNFTALIKALKNK